MFGRVFEKEKETKRKILNGKLEERETQKYRKKIIYYNQNSQSRDFELKVVNLIEIIIAKIDFFCL